MPAIPLGIEAYARNKSGFPETILRNLYLEPDKSGASIDQTLRLQRPGLRPIHDLGAPIRGLFQTAGVFGGVLFIVAGDQLYSSDGANLTTIGTIPNDGDRVTMAANFQKLSLVSAGEYWVWDGETLEQVALPDDKSPNAVEVMNSYFILPLSNGTFYWQTPGVQGFEDANEALNFATAESIPDGLVTVKRLRDDLFFFGSESIEVWQASGIADSAFVRASGRLIDRGCQARETVVDFDNSLIFVGDDGLVYRVADVPQRISTFGIEERIANRSDLCSAFKFTSEGHKFYCLRIPSQGTFAYDAATEQWSEFSTLGQDVWRAGLGRDTPLGPLAADDTGKVFILDPDVATDDGSVIERAVSGTIALTAQRVRNGSIALYAGSVGGAEFSIRWKDALGNWSAPRNLSIRDGSDIQNIWRLGASRGPSRTFEISTVSPNMVRISAAMANETRAA